jgi:hypothetical protein
MSFLSLPKELITIIDDYSSSYEHYQRMKMLLEEYQRRVKPHAESIVYKDAILFDNGLVNWRSNNRYHGYCIFKNGKVVSKRLPNNY